MPGQAWASSNRGISSGARECNYVAEGLRPGVLVMAFNDKVAWHNCKLDGVNAVGDSDNR